MIRITFPLLVLGLLLAPVLCFAEEPNADQVKAIAEIEKVGGKVTVDEKSPGKPVIAVKFNRSLTPLGPDIPPQVTDEGLEHLKGLIKLESLNLVGTKVTGDGVKKLHQALLKCHISYSSHKRLVHERTD